MAKKSKTKSKAKTAKRKKTKTSKKRAAAAAPRGKAKQSPGSKAKKAAPKMAKPAANKASKPRPKKKQQIVGEGDYQASKSFLKDQSDFVARHAGDIPAMGKAAEAALEGPEGSELRAAEEEAGGHSRAAE